MASYASGPILNQEEYRKRIFYFYPLWRIYDPIPPNSITYMDYTYPRGNYYYRRRHHNRYGYYPGTVYGYNSLYAPPAYAYQTYGSSVYVPRGRSSVMLGPLPADFLAIPNSDPVTMRHQQEENDYAMAAQLQMANRTQQVVGRLQVNVVQATLNKNYGMTRMDPYCRLHFGQQIFETQTDINGAKTPVWHKTFFIYQLPRTVNSFLLEVYDERSITDDERVAWVTVPIPETLTTGTSCDNWYNLSGKLGDGIEGKIHIIITHDVAPVPQYGTQMMMYGGLVTPQVGAPLPVYQTPQGPPTAAVPRPPPPPVTDEDVKQVAMMFPDVEESVVKTVLEASYNNKEAAVESLLSMQQNE